MTDFKKLEEVQHDQLYDELFKILIEKTVELDPQLVASTFVALGFQLYKTALSEHDFEIMLKAFVEKSKNLKPFTETIDKKKVH